MNNYKSKVENNYAQGILIDCSVLYKMNVCCRVKSSISHIIQGQLGIWEKSWQIKWSQSWE